MRQLESSSLEELHGQPDGTRFFVVHVLDPETNMVLKGSIAIDPDMQSFFRTKCEEESQPFEEVLPWVAVYKVLALIWGDAPPEGHAIHGIEEVSKEQLLERVQANMARHSALAG